MVNGNHQLPDGWALKTVEELYEVIGGGTPSTSVPEYWNGDIPWITSADITGLKNIQPRKKITQDAVANSATSCVPAGSLIVVTRVSLGKVALTSYPLCFSQDSQALIAKDKSISPEYALYYLAQATQIFKYQGRGTTISGVTKKQLKELPFPVPPLPEQERIVAKIEELFTQLDAGTSALERVQAGLRRYKASVLKAAVSGRLVNGNWEIGEGELPEGWRWTTVGEIGEISGGLTKNSKRHALKKKMPYLRVANVYANELQLDDVSEIGVEEKEIKRALLQTGDLLVVEGNGSPDQVGRVAIWNGSISPCLHQNHIIKVRFEPKEVAEYVLYWLLSEDGREQIAKVASSTSGLYTLSMSKISNLPVPLPPLEEQRRIVGEVERRLSVARQVDSVVEKALVRAGRLRQSVLKSAFEGKL